MNLGHCEISDKVKVWCKNLRQWDTEAGIIQSKTHTLTKVKYPFGTSEFVNEAYVQVIEVAKYVKVAKCTLKAHDIICPH